MIFKLDPRFPLAWRSPFSVQIGIDPPRVILDDVSPSDEQVLAALVPGVTRAGLEMLADGSPDELLDQLAPVLVGPPSVVEHTVVVSGSGMLAYRLSDALARHGVRVYTAEDPDAPLDLRPDLAVLVGQYVLAPQLHGEWLRRDIPHLPIVSSDSGVTIGPLVEPGRGACLVCLELHHRDRDAAWPAVATQLLGRRGTAESAVLAMEAAALGCRIVMQRLAAGTGVSTSIRIDADTGMRTEQTCEPHPDCGCRVVDLSAGRRGSGWEVEARLDPVQN